MYRKLNLDYSRLAQMHDRGLSDPAIGRVLGCSQWTVLYYRRKFALPTNHPTSRSAMRPATQISQRKPEPTEAARKVMENWAARDGRGWRKGQRGKA